MFSCHRETLMKGEYIARKLEFTPNQFCIREINIISHQGKMGVKQIVERT